MSIAIVESRLLSVPLPKSRRLPRVDEDAGAEPAELTVLLGIVHTDTGITGLGFATVPGTGRAEQAMLDDVFFPLALESDPFTVERVYGQARRLCPEITRGGAEARAYSVLDIALWDIQARLANLPLWKLLGGARESVTCQVAATSSRTLSADRVLEIAKPLLSEGIRGLWVGAGRGDAIKDAGKLQRVRDDLGEDVWFGVAGHQCLDLNTALAFGRFLEEEMDADLYADPCPADDIEAYGRLADELEVPIAAGSTLGSSGITDLIRRTRVGVLQPDIGRVGGITPMLKIIDMAECNHRVVMPLGCTEVAIHLGCGRSGVVAIDFQNFLTGCLDSSVQLVEGQLCAQAAIGLGLSDSNVK